MKKWGLIWLCVLLSTIMLLMQGCGNDDSNYMNLGEGQNTDTKADGGWILNKDAKDTVFGDYALKIEGCRVEGRVLFVKCVFTNNSAEEASFAEHFGTELYQNGASLTFCFAGTAGHTMSSKIKPGVSFELEISYILNDTESDVEIEVYGIDDPYQRVALTTETLSIKHSRASDACTAVFLC